MKYLLSSVAIVAALALAAPVWAQGYGPGPGARTGMRGLQRTTMEWRHILRRR
jgi:hypothetical protein